MLAKTLSSRTSSRRRRLATRPFRRRLPVFAKLFWMLGVLAVLLTAVLSAGFAAGQLRSSALDFGNGFSLSTGTNPLTRQVTSLVNTAGYRLENISNAAGQVGSVLSGAVADSSQQFNSFGINLGGTRLNVPLPQPIAALAATGSGLLGSVSNLVSAAFGVAGFGGVGGGAGAMGDGGVRKNTYLGPVFGPVAGYSETASNPSLAARGGHFLDSGVGDVNAILYNVKDYLKYIAGSLAILWLMISAAQLVTAEGDDAIGKAKTGIQWSLGALVCIFFMDVFVVAVLDGGGNNPQDSLLQVINSQLDGSGSTVASYDVNTDFFNRLTTFFTQNIRETFNYLKILTGALSLLFIVLAGFRMVTTAGDDSEAEKEKGYLMHVLTAFVTLLMLDQLIFGFIYPIGSPGSYDATCVEYLADGYQTGGCTSAAEQAMLGSQSILSLVRFFESLIGAIAVFFIVYAGIKIVASFGDEEVISSNKKTVLWGLGGLAVIMLADIAVRRFFFVSNATAGTVTTSAESGLQIVASITNFLATFIGIFSFVSLLIAGVFWVANFGNSELGDKAKGIVIHAALGIVLSVSAYAVVNTLISGASA